MSSPIARHLRAAVLRVNGAALETELLPLLRDRVFHVTKASKYWQIRRDGFVRSNHDGRFPFTYPQSRRSYGRCHGMVSLFDLRGKSDEEVSSTLDKFYFLRPTRALPAFLVLSEAACARLVPPPPSMRELEYKFLWIPESEVFYPGDIPLTEFESALRPQIYFIPDPPEVTAARERALREAMAAIEQARNERLAAERQKRRAERLARRRANRLAPAGD